MSLTKGAFRFAFYFKRLPQYLVRTVKITSPLASLGKDPHTPSFVSGRYTLRFKALQYLLCKLHRLARPVCQVAQSQEMHCAERGTVSRPVDIALGLYQVL